ncbi:hypothetical protein [Streptomyces sp. NPDC098781]|uniref:hypothetical protein n=1 Tax=Streptomyces sp. NPDC098781 TaxID=3366097 RepID=UPI00381F012D
MTYQLRAVIAGEELVRTIATDLSASGTPLGQGLALMPLTDGLFDSVTNGDSARVLGFWWLPGGFDERLAEWSATAPVAFVEADYFGGAGSQRAAVWDAGALVLGPLGITEDERFPPDGSPISQALRRLGVVTSGRHDEFDAVRLGRHRHVEDWAAD